MAYRNVLYVEDGDNISIIAKTPPSVSDPCQDYPAVAQVYRVVVANFDRPVLELVPLSKEPRRLTEFEMGVSSNGSQR